MFDRPVTSAGVQPVARVPTPNSPVLLLPHDITLPSRVSREVVRLTGGNLRDTCQPSHRDGRGRTDHTQAPCRLGIAVANSAVVANAPRPDRAVLTQSNRVLSSRLDRNDACEVGHSDRRPRWLRIHAELTAAAARTVPKLTLVVFTPADNAAVFEQYVGAALANGDAVRRAWQCNRRWHFE